MRVLGSKSIKQFCFDDLADLVLPWSTLLDKRNEEVEMPSDPRFQIAKYMETFVKRVAQAEGIDGHLRPLISEPAINLHGEEAIYAYPLGSWVYHQKLRQLRLLLQLGFELSIYSPEELPGLYWYLSHICATHLSHLDRIRSCVEAEYQRGTVDTAQENKIERKRAFDRTFKILQRHSTELGAIDAFALALNALFILILRYDLLPSTYLSSSKRYSSESLRYELRMKPFFSVSLPEPLPFEFFEKEATLSESSDELVLDRALAAVAEARKALEQCLADGPFLDSGISGTKGEQDKEGTVPLASLKEDWIKDVKDSLRACIATSIAIGTFKKAYTAKPASLSTRRKGKSDDIQPARSPSRRLNLSVEVPQIGSKDRWHDWWIVPKISEILPIRGN
ncbi:predicted protein [Uncinocarpus reesii 1704]|uniref:NAA35-like TPR repeats domain-containing protein n=1 Tax=Uncinocarpus reesii (strain UAMH 1704) TaxID=336963 RepID=C4JMP4_UNCRE|nr:uncharacterized protein UREG_04102 [Uncinocarpus reesii 1704]EEP79256.1 predicted protein [Uncinocarpus reesii 1704]